MWEESFPKMLYAVYEDVDYSLTYTSRKYFNEDPRVYYYYYGGKYATTPIKLDFQTTDLYKTLYSNPELKVELTVNLEVKHEGDCDGKTKLALYIGDDLIEKKELPFITADYNKVSISMRLKGLQAVRENSEIKLGVALSCNHLYEKARFKNLTYSLRISDYENNN